MSGVRIHSLSPSYRIDIGARWEVPPAILPRIEEIWAQESARRGPTLTNGQIYTLSAFNPDRLLIQPAEYRYLLAQRVDPDLRRQGLSIRPAAVTGVLICADGVVLGRRGSAVTDFANHWEPAPAGGLSQPAPTAQLLEELEEELGLPRSEISAVRACGLVEDIENGVFDILFRLETAATERQVRAAFERRDNQEYSALAVIKHGELSAFLEANRGDLLPALAPMLQLAQIS